jgi:cobaltochelatase CobS
LLAEAGIRREGQEGETEQIRVSASALFGFSVPWPVSALTAPSPLVPPADPAFRFDEATTRALLAGFALQRWVLLHGPPGVGKSSHIEQIAARLNWPLLRINFDGHLTRAELIGRDQVQVQDGVAVTTFVPGLLVWALQRPMAVILDEYDAGRPEVLFALQQVLEQGGSLTLLEENRVITPHPQFRLFATANTIGTGDISGAYAGTQVLNQAQLDRWPLVVAMDYLSADRELDVLMSRIPALPRDSAEAMIDLAGLLRTAHSHGDLTTRFTLRSLLAWSETTVHIGSLEESFVWSFLHRCEAAERPLVRELYQRCTGRDLP